MNLKSCMYTREWLHFNLVSWLKYNLHITVPAKAEPQPKFGGRIPSLPTYRREEIAKHNSPDNRVWVTFKHGVYDVTEFAKEGHPGTMILRIIYTVHTNRFRQRHLKENGFESSSYRYLPSANEVWGKVMFYTCLCFCSQGGGVSAPLHAGINPPRQTPFLRKIPLPRQTPPPGRLWIWGPQK